MKKMIPIVRDTVHGLFDRDISGKLVLLNMEATKVARMLSEVLEHFVKIEGQRAVVVSYDRPGGYIQKLIKRFWIPMDGISFIDGAKKMGVPERDDDGANPKVHILYNPFDPKDLIATTTEVLEELSRDTPARSPRASDLDKTMRAELGIYGIQGSEWSIMRHRIKNRYLSAMEDVDRERSAGGPGPDGDMEDKMELSQDTPPCIIVENLAAMMFYFSHEQMNHIIGAFRSLIAKRLCSCVVLLLDRAQYEWVMDGLDGASDIEFSLKTSHYSGVVGYRLVPFDKST